MQCEHRLICTDPLQAGPAHSGGLDRSSAVPCTSVNVDSNRDQTRWVWFGSNLDVSCKHVYHDDCESNSMVSWTDAKVLKLIDLWKEDGTQELWEGSTRNNHIYDKLAAELTKAGYKQTGEQFRCKMKKLRQEYKENQGQ